MNIRSFSEGGKKLLLIKCILEFLADEESLILLDEPDSHIHISRKSKLKDLLAEYHNRENIVTTHSPTLTHCFDPKHIAMLTRGINNQSKVESREKQEIIAQLTDGIWSYQQQNIFLSSNKDLILVEGKTDVFYLRTALEKLRELYSEYQVLDFEILPTNGAEGLENFVGKFRPKPNQTIISFLDRDLDGAKAAKTVLNHSVDLRTFNYETVEGIHVTMYPTPEGWEAAEFIVEDFFSRDYLKEQAIRLLEEAQDKSFQFFPNKIKDKVKEQMPQGCILLPAEKFEGFRPLLDKIIELKALHNE